MDIHTLLPKLSDLYIDVNRFKGVATGVRSRSFSQCHRIELATDDQHETEVHRFAWPSPQRMRPSRIAQLIMQYLNRDTRLVSARTAVFNQKRNEPPRYATPASPRSATSS